MSGVYFLVPTLIAIVILLLVVRAGAIALMMTGMNFDKAKFQALSAFSGTGFTTREAEEVLSNIRRRKIVTWLMILGNAGIVTVIVTATSSFTRAKGLEVGLNILILLAGFALIATVIRHTPVVRRWEHFAQKRLSGLKLFDDNINIDELLHIADGYGVVRVSVPEQSALIGKTVPNINAELEHSSILGVERDNTWDPTPHSSRQLVAGDCLVVYGELDHLGEYFA